MLLSGRKNQLYNYRRKITCPGSSSAEKDLEMDWSQGKPGVSCTMVLQKINAALTQIHWARSLHCLWSQPSSAHSPAPRSIFSTSVSRAGHCTWWNMGMTEKGNRRTIKRPESNTKREEGLFHLEKWNRRTHESSFWTCKVCHLGERKNLPSNVHKVQKSVESDEFTAQLGRCSSDMR